MVKVIVLDSTPLGLLAGPPNPPGTACTAWADGLLAAGHRVVIPEIIDYEVRRELLLRGATRQLKRLDDLCRRVAYAELTTPTMRRAADLWAFARHIGQPTAGDDTIDIDIILVAQALELNDPNAVIATGNDGHVARFFLAELWSNVAP